MLIMSNLEKAIKEFAEDFNVVRVFRVSRYKTSVFCDFSNLLDLGNFMYALAERDIPNISINQRGNNQVECIFY